MTARSDWNQEVQQQLEHLRAASEQLTRDAALLRGSSVSRGITVEVDSSGDILTLHIAPSLMRGDSTQLAALIRDCYKAARADVAAKSQHLIATADPHLKESLAAIASFGKATQNPMPRALTDEEIQAADDEYFRSLNGW
ncbi:YbaB/EbfC family nucleoid-associated protein [Nocardia ignorata]|uniref:YbaB/EbfC DNA-binding family protein n=1 Tax=Nocardia ignorata TaxID=145285 RepID=A0A4R6PV71_NOCIG|nr:YbaB/EbfC family nucleoid-associated protein [Nocardia ignorata]TDP42815.1 YbaB/EbfC DNA-binding family protein [Nocardia ignorata]